LAAILKDSDYADVKQAVLDGPLSKWGQMALLHHGFVDIMLALDDGFLEIVDGLKGKKIIVEMITS